MSIFGPIIKDHQNRAKSAVLESIRRRIEAGRSHLQHKIRRPWPRPHQLDLRLFTMRTQQISDCLQRDTIFCSGLGIKVHAIPTIDPNLINQPSIGFWTRRKDIGNNAVDRTRARKRIRSLAASASIQCGLPGIQYVFQLSGPILFLSPKDIASEIHHAMTILSDHQLARRPRPLILIGSKTINDLRHQLSDFGALSDTLAGQYAASLYSGSRWDGSCYSIVDQMRGLVDRARVDPIVAKAMAMRSAADFRGGHRIKHHCQRCQYQSHLLRYFIGYCYPRGHLQYIPEIIPILSRILSVSMSS